MVRLLIRDIVPHGIRRGGTYRECGVSFLPRKFTLKIRLRPITSCFHERAATADAYRMACANAFLFRRDYSRNEWCCGDCRRRGRSCAFAGGLRYASTTGYYLTAFQAKTITFHAVVSRRCTKVALCGRCRGSCIVPVQPRKGNGRNG